MAESKKAWLQERILGRSQDRSLAQKLANNEYFGRTMAWDAGFEKKLEAATPEQILEAVRQRLDPKAMTIVKAGDLINDAERPIADCGSTAAGRRRRFALRPGRLASRRSASGCSCATPGPR